MQQKRIIKRKNNKPRKQYGKFLKWCGVYIVTAACTGILGGMAMGIAFELVR